MYGKCGMCESRTLQMANLIRDLRVCLFVIIKSVAGTIILSHFSLHCVAFKFDSVS